MAPADGWPKIDPEGQKWGVDGRWISDVRFCFNDAGDILRL